MIGAWWGIVRLNGAQKMGRNTLISGLFWCVFNVRCSKYKNKVI